MSHYSCKTCGQRYDKCKCGRRRGNIVDVPTTPAPAGTLQPVEGHALDHVNFCLALLGIILLRNEGATMSFNQEDFNAVTGLVVLEGRNEKGEFIISLGHPVDGKAS